MTPFNVHILGCGSATPTLRHNPSMQIVDVRGKLMMIDCGEGAQKMIRAAGLSFVKISRIFISHLHGDHCFGLIGLISSMGLLGRTADLHVYAPAEFEPMLQSQIDFFIADLSFQVVFHPVDTTRHQIICEDRAVEVWAVPLAHRVPCAGFIVREKPTLPHIRRDMIDAFDIPVSQIDNIKAGSGFTTSDGTYLAHEQLVEPADPPRAYAYCSDTRYLPEIVPMIAGVDVLYHEATYANDKKDNAAKYFHSTAEDAARIAQAAQVGRLVIGHFSNRYEDETLLLNEALPYFPRTELAREKMIIRV